MARTSEPTRSAADFLPKRVTLRILAEAAEGCRGCDLYRDATQTVFGEGVVTATVHPSSILRAPDDAREAERALFVRDPSTVAAELERQRRSA